MGSGHNPDLSALQALIDTSFFLYGHGTGQKRHTDPVRLEQFFQITEMLHGQYFCRNHQSSLVA